MSNAHVQTVPGPNDLVAANLRAEMGRQRWTGRKMAAALGMTAPYVNRRMSGATPMTAEDMVMFADLIGIPVTRLFLGMQKGPAGGAAGPSLPELDSNQQPAG